jgi:hypothetical protein
MKESGATAATWGTIRKAFAEYFAVWGIELPSSLSEGKGSIHQGGWSIDWLVGVRRGNPYLDFSALHRMTNPRHHRIHASGKVIWLPAERDVFLFESGSTEVATAAKRARYDRQNARVSALLRRKFVTEEATLPEEPGDMTDPDLSSRAGAPAPLPDAVRRFVDSASWTFAKTYATTWPHEYIVRRPQNAEMLDALARHIFEHGVDGRFYTQVRKYHHENGKAYWSMDDTPESTTLINRCNDEQTYEARLKGGTLPSKAGG